MRSPAGRISRSRLSSQRSIVLSYLSFSRGWPKQMLSLIFLFWIHGTYWTYETFLWRWIGLDNSLKLYLEASVNSFLIYKSSRTSWAFSSTKLWGRHSISPIIAESRELLPAPTSPIMQTNSPFAIQIYKFLRDKALLTVRVSLRSTCYDWILSSLLCVCGLNSSSFFFLFKASLLCLIYYFSRPQW